MSLRLGPGPYDHDLAGQDGSHANGSAPGSGPPGLRTPYARRRAITAGAALLVVLLIAVALSGGRASHPAAAARKPRPKLAAALPLSPAAEAARESAAIDRVLGYTSYIRAGQPLKREVALTFDDGPGPYTNDVLSVLLAHDTPATFFEVGSSIRDFGPIISSEVSNGYVIGDHTENHRLMSALSPRDQATQLIDQADLLATQDVPFPRLFRPPYGGFNDHTLALLHHYRMIMVLWSIDTEDYLQPGVSVIVHRALTGVHAGSIILMHDAGGQRSQTVGALPLIIAGLARRHLTPVTVPRLIADDPPPIGQGPPMNLSGLAG